MGMSWKELKEEIASGGIKDRKLNQGIKSKLKFEFLFQIRPLRGSLMANN
jgi:hypothetical protein